MTILTNFDYFNNFRQFWKSTIVDNFCQNLMFLTSLTIVWHFEKMTILTIVDSFDIFYKYRKSDFLSDSLFLISTPLLVYLRLRATRWDQSQSSRIEKTMIFTKINIFYMKKYEKIAINRFFFEKYREKYQKCPKIDFFC